MVIVFQNYQFVQDSIQFVADTMLLYGGVNVSTPYMYYGGRFLEAQN